MAENVQVPEVLNLRLLPGTEIPEGDAWAWLRAAIADHGAMLWRFVLPRVAGAADVADSVCQDTWQALARQPVPPHEMGAWLRGTARHKILDEFRRERRRTFWEVPLQAFHSVGQDPEEVLERSWDTELVWAALRRLAARERQVLILHYLEGWSVADMAALLRKTPKSVECQLYRARTSFRGLYRGAEDD